MRPLKLGFALLLTSMAFPASALAVTKTECERKASFCLESCSRFFPENMEAYNKCLPFCDQKRTACLAGSAPPQAQGGDSPTAPKPKAPTGANTGVQGKQD